MKTGKWKCRLCGKPTTKSDKVCVICASESGETSARGLADREKIAGKGKTQKRRPRIAGHINDPTMCDALSRALDLEVEGREFYIACAQRTKNGDGKAMFNFLSKEEKKHYENVSKLFEAREYDGYCEYVEAKGLKTGVFKSKVLGGNLDGKADALDALNISLAAEDQSIELYETLAGASGDAKMRRFFEKLVGEERKHRNILENEVEFVTGTGQFKDFRTVTM